MPNVDTLRIPERGADFLSLSHIAADAPKMFNQGLMFCKLAISAGKTVLNFSKLSKQLSLSMQQITHNRLGSASKGHLKRGPREITSTVLAAL